MRNRKWTELDLSEAHRSITADIARGMRMKEALARLSLPRSVYYRWRAKHTPPISEEVKRVKELELENTRLRRVIADQALDNAMLREVAKGNF